MGRQSRASHSLNRCFDVEGGEGREGEGKRKGGEAEFMPVAAVHPPSPTPRSYLAELSRSAIPPNHHREYRHETEPCTRTHVHTLVPFRCQPSPPPFGLCNFLLLSRFFRSRKGFDNFTIFLLASCETDLTTFSNHPISESLV